MWWFTLLLGTRAELCSQTITLLRARNSELEQENADLRLRLRDCVGPDGLSHADILPFRVRPDHADGLGLTISSVSPARAHHMPEELVPRVRASRQGKESELHAKPPNSANAAFTKASVHRRQLHGSECAEAIREMLKGWGVTFEEDYCIAAYVG